MATDYCPNCGTIYHSGIWNFPCTGDGDHVLGSFYTGPAKIHYSDRPVVIRNPQTGETRRPGRADRPIHPKYIAAGFTERVTLDTHQEIKRYEKDNGLVHESSHYNQNSVTAERDTNSR